jgi:hypothetical protein
MSSSMVSKECMDNIVSGLYSNRDLKMRYPRLYEEQKLEKESDYRKLAKKLFELNLFALNERYPNEPETSSYKKIPEFKMTFKHVSDFQLLKSVQCLMYQCSEGKVIKEELYQWIFYLGYCVANLIIERMEEYKKAVWG